MELLRLSSIMLAVCLVAPAWASPDWGTDMPAALAQAAQEDKLVLANFNGSDWCGPCIALHREVLNQEGFRSYAADKFVLLDVDLPKKKELPEGVYEANKALMATYKVTIFPTVLVINKDGVVLGGFAGGRTDLAPVQLDLDRAYSRKAEVDALMARAAASSGHEKTQALIGAYEAIPTALQVYNEQLLAAIVASDPKDELGFIAKLAQAKEARRQAVIKEQELSQRISKIPLSQRVAAIDELIAAPTTTNDELVRLKWLRLNTLFLLCETPADLDQVKAEMMNFAEGLDAGGKEKTNSIIRAIFASEPSDLLQRIRNMRGNEPS